MNEEDLASLLDEYLTGLLDGQAVATAPPDEIADLLNIAQHLTASAPIPRPEFTTELRTSLLSPTNGVGTAGSMTAAAGNKISLLTIVGVAILIGTALVVGAIIFRASRSNEQSTPTLPVSTGVPTEAPTPTSEAPTLTAVPTATVVEAMPTAQPTATATTTPTPLTDIIPPIVIIDVVDPPIDLVPDEPTPIVNTTEGNNSANNDGDDANTEGDHDRGHGNDPDRQDEDNPGRGNNK